MQIFCEIIFPLARYPKGCSVVAVESKESPINQDAVVWNPYELEVILHYNSSPDEFPHPETSKDAGMFVSTMARLISLEVIEDRAILPSALGTSKHRLTEKGRAFVALLCKTPLPKQQWVDPRDWTCV